jgi:hypothetical protein
MSTSPLDCSDGVTGPPELLSGADAQPCLRTLRAVAERGRAWSCSSASCRQIGSGMKSARAPRNCPTCSSTPGRVGARDGRTRGLLAENARCSARGVTPSSKTRASPPLCGTARRPPRRGVAPILSLPQPLRCWWPALLTPSPGPRKAAPQSDAQQLHKRRRQPRKQDGAPVLPCMQSIFARRAARTTPRARNCPRQSSAASLKTHSAPMPGSAAGNAYLSLVLPTVCIAAGHSLSRSLRGVRLQGTSVTPGQDAPARLMSAAMSPPASAWTLTRAARPK